jgi:Mg-chelatase subunit ChlD
VACSVQPAVGNGGAAGSSGAGAGGTPSNAGGNAAPGEGGAAGGPVFVLPDASTSQADDATTDNASAPASGDANCGSTQSKLEKKPGDLLLVLDRSSSMGEAMDSSKTCRTGSTTCSQRWDTIISSLGKVLASSSKDLNWGLKFFSSPATSGSGGRGGFGNTDNCYVSTGVEVPIGPGNTDKIAAQISAAGNAGNTPTRSAIDNAVAYLKTVNDSNNKFILLATDGEPNCGSGGFGSTSSDLPATLTAVKNAVTAGYKVYVIGVGSEAANLTSLAQAGGTEKFYSALTPDDLNAALSTIVGTVTAGCTYELPSQPIAPNAVGVYVDKSAIPQSDTDGWSYAPGSSTTINIHGSICDDLTSGKKTQVEIFLPCKASDVIPTIIP